MREQSVICDEFYAVNDQVHNLKSRLAWLTEQASKADAELCAAELKYDELKRELIAAIAAAGPQVIEEDAS